MIFLWFKICCDWIYYPLLMIFQRSNKVPGHSDPAIPVHNPLCSLRSIFCNTAFWSLHPSLCIWRQLAPDPVRWTSRTSDWVLPWVGSDHKFRTRLARLRTSWNSASLCKKHRSNGFIPSLCIWIVQDWAPQSIPCPGEIWEVLWYSIWVVRWERWGNLWTISFSKPVISLETDQKRRFWLSRSAIRLQCSSWELSPASMLVC